MDLRNVGTDLDLNLKINHFDLRLLLYPNLRRRDTPLSVGQ